MRTHVVILSVCWSLLVIWVSAVFCQGPTPQDMVYLEAEQALPNGWHAVQTTPSASGGKNIGWFEQGKTLILPLTVPALSDGLLYVRYSRGEKTQSGLAVAITRPDTPRAEFSQAKQIGVMPCDPTRNYGTYTWQSIALGQLAAGNYWLLLSPQGEKASVNIDAVIVIDDHWHRLWSPANVYKDGKAVDAGKILPAVNWNADSTAFRGVYSPGDAITFTVAAANRSSLPVNFALPWEIVDFSGKSIATGKIATALPAGGNDQKTVTLARSLPQGWYAVRFSPADGPAERLFVVMPAMQEKDRKASRFGINTHGADGKEDYAMMARLGVGWLRGLTNWHFVQGSNVQPWQDKPYNWKDGDTNLAYSEAYGLQRMGSLAFSVAWASSTDPATKNWWGASTYPPDDLTPNGPYASYIKKMVERYHDHVQYWEHWNEPDLSAWKGTPEQYVQCLQTAYNAVKSVDPNAVVMNGGYANIGMGKINQMLKANVQQSSDILAFHGYRDTLAKVWPIKRVFQKAGVKVKRMWNTECGMEPNMLETKPFAEKMPWYREQANEVIRAMTLQFACGVERVFWFCYGWEPYAVFSPIGPRPSAMAYRTLSDLIDTPTPAQYLGTLDLGPNAREFFAFVFKRPDGAAIIMWKDDTNSPLPEIAAQRPKEQVVTIPIDRGAQAVCYGVDGRQLPAAVQQDQLTVHLANEPVMVKVTGSMNGIQKRIGWTPRYGGDVLASITFAETPQCRQMYAMDRTSSTTVVDGMPCWRTDRVNGKGDTQKYYFRINMSNDLFWEICDDAGRVKFPVQMRITFLDKGKQPFGIQYGERDVSVPKSDSGQWKTVDVDLSDAAFPNSGYWASFRLTNWGWSPTQEDLYIHEIELIRKK